MLNKSIKRVVSRITLLTAVTVTVCLMIASCTGITGQKAKDKSDLDYSDTALWVSRGDESSKEADCFLICPTVYIARGRDKNMPVNDPVSKSSFTGAANAQKRPYSDLCSMYIPLYRQASIEVYEKDAKEAEQYFDIAYADVEKAFLFYMKNYNQGRPLVLAGFSQGSDMCIRLLKDHGNDPKVKGVLVSCYAIGWRVTDKDVADHPHLKTAQGENDTGVIVTYDCEAVDVKKSLVVPEGMKTRSINPLNWKTDSTPADKMLNKGSVMNDGSIAQNLTGCYIDPDRGTLKVTDISKSDYPPGPSCFSEGEYHVHDVNLFFENLKENVSVRIKAFGSAGKGKS